MFVSRYRWRNLECLLYKVCNLFHEKTYTYIRMYTHTIFRQRYIRSVSGGISLEPNEFDKRANGNLANYQS